MEWATARKEVLGWGGQCKKSLLTDQRLLGCAGAELAAGSSAADGRSHWDKHHVRHDVVKRCTLKIRSSRHRCKQSDAVGQSGCLSIAVGVHDHLIVVRSNSQRTCKMQLPSPRFTVSVSNSPAGILPAPLPCCGQGSAQTISTQRLLQLRARQRRPDVQPCAASRISVDGQPSPSSRPNPSSAYQPGYGSDWVKCARPVACRHRRQHAVRTLV